MTNNVWNVIGNGDLAACYKFRQRAGKNIICNMPPFEMLAKDVYATVMVDFKMMAALTEGSLNLDMYPWILGTRPQVWMQDPRQSGFYLKYAPNVREFYTHVPKYAQNATNFNCGHMAVHYTTFKKKADVIHMFGFDTLFDFNMRSVTDLYLSSDRGSINNFRLIENWRPVWDGIFKEAEQKQPDTKFVLHHNHDGIKIQKRDNMEIVTYDLKEEKKRGKIIKNQKIVELSKEQLAGLNRAQRRAYEAQLRKGTLSL